ncbi:MAG: hypothetical protein K0R34_684 [Herbinix sp.]|jgi:hypothetical protein|nr:hypothetical protein [Herbinix sp.]
MGVLSRLEITPGIVAALIAAVIVLAIGIYIQTGAKKGKQRSALNKTDEFFCRLYFEFKKVAFIKRYISVKTIQLQMMSVYTKKEVYTMVAKQFALAATITATTVIVALTLFDDLVSVSLCAVFSFILPSIMFEKKMGRINHVVIYQLKYAVEAIRLEYLRCDSVVEALETATYGKRLIHIMDELHNVLISADGELKLKEFYELTPFGLIQSLAQICYHTNNTGDEKDNFGNSSFVEALLVMTQDINQELELLDYRKVKFGNLEYLCLAPVLAIKPIEWFLLTYMPATAMIFHGTMGYVIRVAIILESMITFTVVARRNNVSVLKDDDRIQFLVRLLRNNSLNRFIRTISPKNLKRRRLKMQLQNAFSKKSIEELWLEKLLYSIAIFTILILTFSGAINLGKGYMRVNTSSLNMLASDDEMSAFPKEDILSLDEEYIALREDGYVFEEDEIKELISSYLPGLTKLQLSDQINRLEKKYLFLQNAYFKWYFIPISFFAALCVWVVPDYMLKNRKKLLMQEEEKEFLQIQVLMIILMGMNCDTMEAVEYLSQLTRIHKDIFLYCYNGYASDPVEELRRMEDKTPIPEFKQFIHKLRQTVDELSLEEAFGDLKMEREHIARGRDVFLRASIDRNRNQCGGLVKIGTVMIVLLLVMFPLLYIGFMDMMSGIQNLNGL